MYSGLHESPYRLWTMLGDMQGVVCLRVRINQRSLEVCTMQKVHDQSDKVSSVRRKKETKYPSIRGTSSLWPSSSVLSRFRIARWLRPLSTSRHNPLISCFRFAPDMQNTRLVNGQSTQATQVDQGLLGPPCQLFPK